jgi:membrane associated rhomboid family serine protease
MQIKIHIFAENKDKMNQHRSSFLDSIPPVVKNLLVINLLFWLAAITLHQMKGINVNYWLGLHYWEASNFYPFQFITYMFLHSLNSFGHLFFNMFGLFMFGRILEYKWWSKRFLIYYMITGIGAGIIQQITWTIDFYPISREIANLPVAELQRGINMGGGYIIHSMDELFVLFNGAITVGASGSIMGLLLAFGMLFPNQPLFIMFIPVPIKAKYVVIGYAVIELFLGVGNFQFDNIAHFAHLGGMLFGYFLIRKWKRDANNRMSG